MNGQPDNKVIERVRKLLALAAKGSGATEAEASLAAERAAEIMEEHGLTMMVFETQGGEAEKRERVAANAAANTPWTKPLMEAVAESCFCYCATYRDGAKFNFTLFGRQSSVASAQIMFDYLRLTIWRLRREVTGQVESPHHFSSGCAERIIERLRTRHATRLREQKEEAERKMREAAARGPSSSTALVVTLVDYEQREKDLNQDAMSNLPAGTTEQRRKEREARARAQDARYEELKKEGIKDGVAWNMAYLAQDRARAEAYEAEWQAKQRRSSRRSSSWTQADERAWRAQERKTFVRQSSSWQAGRAAGETVGLDQQIDKAKRRS